MTHWEYKTLTYLLEGKHFYSLRYWGDASAGKVYGPQERATLVGGVWRQMRQLEEALKELDKEGWELVSVSVWTAFLFTRHGCAVLRRPASQA